MAGEVKRLGVPTIFFRNALPETIPGSRTENLDGNGCMIVSGKEGISRIPLRYSMMVNA
jgi:hypothetical protein